MKKLFVFIVTLSLVVSVIWAGTPIPGTVVAAKITTGNTDNTFSIGDTIEMLGTCKQVADNTARDAIPAERRAEGMQVWVIATQTAWRLVGGIANGNWQVEHLALPADASGALTNDGVGNLGWNPSVGVTAVVTPGQNITVETNAGPNYKISVTGTLTNNTTGRSGFVDDISTNQIPLSGVTNAGTAAYSNANVFAFLSANNVFTGGSNHFVGDVGIDGSQYVGTLVPTNITGPVFSVPMPFVGSNGAGAFGFSYNGGSLTNIQSSAISNLRTQWSVSDITNAGNLAYSNSIKVANVSDAGTAAYSNATAFFLASQAGNLAYSNSIKVANITDAGTLAYSNATPNAAGALTNNGTGTKGWYSGYAPLDAANVFTGSNFVNNTIESIQHGVTTNAWSGPTNDIDLSIERVDYVTTTPLKVTGFINKPTKFEHSVVLTVSNSTAVDKIMYLPTGVTTDDGQSSYTVTNQSLRIFSFRYSPVNYTNAVSRQFPGGSSGGGSGTVTSVALAAPAEFTVSGSPVTGAGTLTFTKANQSANNIYAGPASGAAAVPTFRAAVALDVTTNAASTGSIVYSPDGTLLANLAQPTVAANLGSRPRVPATQGSALQMLPVSQFGTRRVAYWYPVASPTLTAVGEAVTIAGTAPAQINATSTAHRLLEYFTPAANNNTNAVSTSSGCESPSTHSGNYTFVCQVTNASGGTGYRMWVGLSSSTFDTIASTETNTARNVIAFLGSTTNWANWQFATCDGNSSDWTFTDTGVALSTAVTNFQVIINGTGAAINSAVGVLNGNVVATNTAHLPAMAARKGIGIATTDAGNAAAGFRLAWVQSETDQ